MNILLFHPRGKPWSSRPDISFAAAIMPPLGLLSIAAVLRKAGHSVTVFDAALNHNIPNPVWVKKIVALSPDIVGFSAMTSAFYDAYDVCEKLKQSAPDIATLFGGVHASWGKGMLLERFKAIDMVLCGEGESAMLDLASGAALSSIAGLYYRNGPKVEQGPGQSSETISNLDDLPFPAYNLLSGFPRQYRMPLFGYTRHPGANIASSRGCVYQCSYCDRSVFGRSFRFNSPQYTVDQIAWLAKDYGVRHINFYDDLFTLNRNRVAGLCEKLADAHLGIRFNCIVRIGHIDDELIRLLKRGGCWMVNVGIESGDQQLLDTHKEGLTVEAIRRDIGKLDSAGLWVKGLFMMGFPGETLDSIKKTREFACSLPLKDANITAFTPFPGAPIYQEISHQGLFDDDWSKMDCVNFVFVSKEAGNKKILQQNYRAFIREFYQRKSMRPIYRKMMIESPHSFWRILAAWPTYLSYMIKTNKS